MEQEPTTSKARCGIYETRPQVCRDYPKIDHYQPEECTFSFVGNERRGECACGVGACCNTPRENGEPGGAPMPSLAGGKPCKHLVWEEESKEKEASEPPSSTPSTDFTSLVGGFGGGENSNS
jgi:hypothetical protein